MYNVAMTKIGFKIRLAAVVFVFAVFAASCSSVGAAVATSLSGAGKNGVPRKGGGNSAMLAITGERDVSLVSDFFPTALVLYEILRQQNPGHLGMAAMTGQLNVMYANAFVQSPAEDLSILEFDLQIEEFERAKMHYLRGRDYCLDALDGRHKGLRGSLFSGSREEISAAVEKLNADDVATAYWCGAGWLGAFSLDPLNPDLLEHIAAPVALLEKVAALEPDYSGGSIWDLLFNFYVSAPEMFGGDYERGLYCHEEAMRVSGGKTPGPYITYARSVCIPANDRAGFEQALGAAIAIDADADPSSRLMTLIYQKRAKKLLENIDDYFLEWD